jgi:hypothetical protein
VLCDPLYKAAVLACSTCDLMVVLMNPGPFTRCGGSSTVPEAASRVVMSAPALGRHPYADSRD